MKKPLAGTTASIVPIAMPSTVAGNLAELVGRIELDLDLAAGARLDAGLERPSPIPG